MFFFVGCDRRKGGCGFLRVCFVVLFCVVCGCGFGLGILFYLGVWGDLLSMFRIFVWGLGWVLGF